MKIWKNTRTLDELVPFLSHPCSPSEAEIAVIGSKAIDLDEFPNLRGVFKCGVGRDNVPEALLSERQIEVCFPSDATQNTIYDETSSFAVHLILRMLYSDLGSIDSWIKKQRQSLESKTVLVIGLGNIGGRVKEKLTPMVNVSEYDILSSVEEDLKGLVEGADVISLHVPLTDSTRHLMDSEKLGWMKDGAAVVNTARGPVVEESAFLSEVRTGRLRGAFDVFWEEPYKGPLREFHPSSFLMSPHVASNCNAFLEGLADDFSEFVKKFGEPGLTTS